MLVSAKGTVAREVQAWVLAFPVQWEMVQETELVQEPGPGQVVQVPEPEALAASVPVLEGLEGLVLEPEALVVWAPALAPRVRYCGA
jgi:hypothetical protein